MLALPSWSDDEIVAEVDKELQVLLKPDAPPPKVLGIKLWPTAIPQYELGHADIIEELEAAEEGGSAQACRYAVTTARVLPSPMRQL